jgi:hypothetical protein
MASPLVQQAGRAVQHSTVSDTECRGDRGLDTGVNNITRFATSGNLSFLLLALCLALSKECDGGEVGRAGAAGRGGGGAEVSKCWGSGTTPVTSL